MSAPASGALLALDERAWAHVAVALSRYVRAARTDGAQVPPVVARLLEVALICARGRQEAPTVDALGELVDAAPVSLLLRPAAVAAALDVSERTVDRLLASGALASVRVSGTRRVRRADLEDFVAGLPSRDNEGSSDAQCA